MYLGFFSQRWENSDFQLLDCLTLEQSKFEKCDIVPALILWVIKCHISSKSQIAKPALYVKNMYMLNKTKIMWLMLWAIPEKNKSWGGGGQ